MGGGQYGHMDECDVLLEEINRENGARLEKKFWRGEEWTKERIRKMELRNKARLELNQIKSGQELRRKQREGTHLIPEGLL
jgi:SRSO17 transposase